ncbi:hypothetical protein BJ508DRAFT_325598 [Ascobolus immersus RN42]|uniref:CxC1-like cysteine cluster associated with KDZ transposases domain-containing protein n=1 Tax=Ascobolus immersus RN42 TaxID=1160509 RepID=A0A3N4IA31_ASCIM|nr:hypothetical protein BJ508DRAFT_325598 [Ascobolus immersus RN42]
MARTQRRSRVSRPKRSESRSSGAQVWSVSASSFRHGKRRLKRTTNTVLPTSTIEEDYQAGRVIPEEDEFIEQHNGPWELDDDSDDEQQWFEEGGRPGPKRNRGIKRELGPDFFELEGETNMGTTPSTRAGETAARNNRNSLRLEEIVGLVGRAWARETMNCRCLRLNPVQIHCIGFMESEKKTFHRCKCPDWFATLVLQGYFPTRALNPATAISIPLLQFMFFQATRGSFSKDGFALALEDLHQQLLLPERKPSYSASFRLCFPFYHRARKCRDDYIRALLAQEAKEKYNALRADRLEDVQSARASQADMLDVVNADRSSRVEVEVIPKPLDFRQGSFAELCPCCFYRPDPNDASPVITCLDGNFQHRRYKNAAKNDAQFRYASDMFFDPPMSMMNQVNFVPPKEETLCSSNFRATAAKPTSMKRYDETGLLAMVCRHDAPLRLMNLHAGERLLWVTDFLEKTLRNISNEGIKIEKMILMYDIACQLDAFIHNKKHGSPFLVSQLEVVVNKFHGYGHEFRCHERWGAHQKRGVAKSDGEGVERLWAVLRFLVVSGKTSSPANKKLFLELFTLVLAQRKRHTIGTTLTERYTKALLHRSTADNLLNLEILRHHAKSGKQVAVENGADGAFGTAESEAGTVGGSGPERQGGNDMLPDPIITEELLRSELAKRIDYFQKTPSLANHDYVTVYDAIVAEREVEEKIEEINTQYERGELDEDEHTDLISKYSYDILQKKKKRTNELLERYKQTPEDWEIGGELWRAAAQKRTPDQKIFDKLVVEEKTRKEIETISSQPAGPQRIRRLALARGKLAKQMKATQLLLDERGMSRSDWDQDKDLYETHLMRDVTRKLEHIYRRILQNAAGRSMQLQELKARSSGHNNSAKLVQGVQKAYPAISADIEAFNKLSKLIQNERLRPPELSIAAFIASAEDDDVGEKARDSLFALHLLRTATLEGLENRVHDITKALWSSSALVRTGIRELSKRDRALEEIHMVQKEWKRMTTYIVLFLETLLDYLDRPEASCRRAIAYMLWEELPTAENLITSCEKMEAAVLHAVGDLPIPPSLKPLVERAKVKVRQVIYNIHIPDRRNVGSETPDFNQNRGSVEFDRGREGSRDHPGNPAIPADHPATNRAVGSVVDRDAEPDSTNDSGESETSEAIHEHAVAAAGHDPAFAEILSRQSRELHADVEDEGAASNAALADTADDFEAMLEDDADADGFWASVEALLEAADDLNIEVAPRVAAPPTELFENLEIHDPQG